MLNFDQNKLNQARRIIGRTDKADFPELHLSEIDIKVDTGAYTSSIHCHKIREVLLDGKQYIKFTLLDPSHPDYNEKEFMAENYSMKLVKSSNGTSEERYLIKTDIRIFEKTFPIELTLSERSDMKYPVLLGRKFLYRRFVVDVSAKNLSYQSKNKP